ncbi:hypothetical protein VKT23_011959 [Stygiomarasmius scandens]|uniref:DUF6534 domain-containing protein n=1 Tax=Marasmiellus scandens TaxID=2682957 RepID=A0ABR1J7G0_9AGAR
MLSLGVFKVELESSLLDFTTTCLDTQILHHYLVSNFGDPEIIAIITKPICAEYLITIITVFSVQVFFASRVWLLGRVHWIVPVLILLGATGAAVLGITSAVGLFQNDFIVTMQETRQKFEIGWNCTLSAFSDIVSTVALSWSFSSFKTGIKPTDTLLQKLFHYTVTRGLFVSVDQTMNAIIYLSRPDKLWWTPFHLSLSKVYVITMIAMLNSRKNLRKTTINIITDSEMGVHPEPSQPIVFLNKDPQPDHELVTTPFHWDGDARGHGKDSNSDDNNTKFEGSQHNGIHITKEQLPPQVI